MMGKFLISLAGARADILDRCDTERLKFQSLGIAILITSVMAVISMWFALTSAMGFNPVGSFLIALIWGMIILGIDRWLVTSMPTDGSRRWPIAVSRLVLAILLGTLISTPLVLRAFQSEINAEITVIKEQRASAFLTQQQNSSVNQQVTTWTKQVNNLEAVIGSNGNESLSPSDDAQIQTLTAQKNSELALEQKDYQQWQCQLYGGSGCTVKGDGPLAQADENAYYAAQDQVNKLNNEIQQRLNALSADNATSAHTRYEQAVVALPAAKQQLATATAQEGTLRSNFEAENDSTNGLLIRLQALNQLSGGNFTLNAARFLLFLLFVVIECLPVTVKLLQQPGTYEELLAERARLDLKDAKRAMRTRRFTGGGAEGASLGGQPGTAQEADESVLGQIWRPRTKLMDMPARQNEAETATVDRAEEPDEDVRLDEALRNMTDIHASSSDSGERRGGIELRYRDDDL
jgi:hypothetical protein